MDFVIPQYVSGYLWNNSKAPQGTRLKMNLKAIFAVR
jgi:hypothetical protein